MITLEQIKQLELKVHKAVELILSLKNENSLLNKKLEEYQKRIDELEVLISGFREDQTDIESGILDIITQLNRLEDDILKDEKKDKKKDKIVTSKELEDIDKNEEINENESTQELDIF